MRVLHVMECTIGGTRRHLVDVAAGQRALGLDVALAVSALRQPEVETDLARLERLGARVHRVPMVRELSPLADARDLRALRRVLRAERPDVVHPHASKAGALGRMASVLEDRGARVHTPHTFAFLFGAMFSGPKRALFRAIEHGLAGHTARTIAVSASEGRTICASGVVDRARARGEQHRSRALARGGLVPRAELCDDPRADRAGAGLERSQGQTCWSKRSRGPVWSSCTSRSPVRARTRPLCALGARARRGRARALLGFRTDACPGSSRRRTSWCCLLRWEGMPYAVLEAMASARPVVATPVDGAVDLVRDGATGELASAIGVEALASALRAQLARTADERRAQGAAARARVLSDHTAAAMVRGIADVYREALA